MFSIKVSDVSEALQRTIEHLLQDGVEESSRNGPVLVAPGPVCVEYTNPKTHVLLSPTRDANAVFHFFESLWMLAGDNDIEFPCYFNKSYAQFSDDGAVMADGYGYRWRNHFGHDQLEEIAAELRTNPTSRRCVLSMWDAHTPYNNHDPEIPLHSHDDLYVATHGGKAVPCNLLAVFAIRGGKLNMTVTNRSNDLIWGLAGANAVHFSLLLEYMAMRIGVPMGSYFQISVNVHVYLEKFDRKKLEQIAFECDTTEHVATGPAIPEGFDDDLKLFMTWARQVIRAPVPAPTVPVNEPIPEAWTLALGAPQLKTEFFYAVAVPMFLFWVYRKWGDEYSSNVCLNGIDAPDWQCACAEWAERRKK